MRNGNGNDNAGCKRCRGCKTVTHEVDVVFYDGGRPTVSTETAVIPCPWCVPHPVAHK